MELRSKIWRGVRLVAASAVAAACHRAEASSSRPATDTNVNVYTIVVHTLEGAAENLSSYAGKVTLLVNVASYCGNTPQYTALEALHQRYAAQGFSVLGFPSNDFGQQEPGSATEIRAFCSSKYKVTFPLFEKLRTRPGQGQAELYQKLEQATGKVPTWNFSKYLIGRDGHVIEYFGPKVLPDDPKLVGTLETALKAPLQ